MTMRGKDDDVSSEAWLRRTLDEILVRVRQLLDLEGCAFQVVDWEQRTIHADRLVVRRRRLAQRARPASSSAATTPSARA